MFKNILLISILIIISQSVYADDQFHISSCEKVKAMVMDYIAENSHESEKCVKQSITIEDTTIVVEVCDSSKGMKQIDRNVVESFFKNIEKSCSLK
jgi:hypothetical protein